jgi:DNA-binding beta-propeller fold protein YncE
VGAGFGRSISECIGWIGSLCRGADSNFSWAITTLVSGFSNPYGVAVDGSGNVFVADFNNSTVKEILAVSGYTTVNTLSSGFNSPVGVAVDGRSTSSSPIPATVR